MGRQPQASPAHDVRVGCAFLKPCKNQNTGCVREPRLFWPPCRVRPGLEVVGTGHGMQDGTGACRLPFQEEAC